ncbi:MAG: hypothetical protein ACT4OU_12845 [Hyphomicrobium sp.]
MAISKDYAGELQAMGSIMEALAPLESASQLSVMRWVIEKLQLDVSALGVQSDTPLAAEGSGSNQARVGNINTVVSRIGADSCRTLLIAAAIYLTLYQGKEAFTRSEWVATAKSAKVWKNEYVNQSSTMIGRLADGGQIVEKSKDTYYLPDSTIAQYADQL